MNNHTTKVLFVTIISVLISCKSSVPSLDNNRQLLKEFAYCKCIENANLDSTVFQNDVSISIYKEISNYNSEVFTEIESAAMKFAKNIKPPMLSDYKNKKTIFLDCFVFYKSKSLDSLVKRMDAKVEDNW